MSDHLILEEHRHAMESLFFSDHDRALLEYLQEHRDEERELAALGRATGVADHEVLQLLFDRGIRAETATALALAPLVEVAWADGEVADEERAAVLQAAHEAGVVENSPSHELLERWLRVQPSRAMRAAWANYVMALCQQLAPHDRRRLKEQVLGKAHTVAAAAGGILGLGSKISSLEQDVLDELAQAFE